MRLFHGSNLEITEIDLAKCRPYKDFGRGFYLTTRPEQAVKMAQRVARIYGGAPCVTEYSFDETAFSAKDLRTLRFEKPSEAWALFVINNRNRHFADVKSLACNHDNQ